MVIIASKEGQLANRILHASSFFVNAKENSYKVIHPFFEDFYQYFSENLVQHKKFIKFWGKKKSWSSSFIQSTLTIFIKLFLKLRIKKLPFFEIIEYKKYEQGTAVFDLSTKEFIKKARSKIVFVYGWLFRDPVNQEKHKEWLLEFWKPNERYCKNVKNYHQKYKRDCDLLVGVHVRGGDYKNFEGGKWYYTPEQYYDKMKELTKLQEFSGKKIGFVICTNEKDISFPASEFFSVLNETRHFVEDMYLLSKCNFIIGPPSTFSIWASFYGDVPLYMIKEINQPIRDQNFTHAAILK